MTATVDRTKCIGCGLCVDMCPEVFEMASDSVATVKTSPVPSAQEGSCREAASSCPVEAIAVS